MEATATAPLHETVGVRLAGFDQRYTAIRRLLVETIARSGRPLTIPEILAVSPELPRSSAYRNVTVLIEAGILRRVTGSDEHGRFELAEQLSGHHHHHLVCTVCGRVDDVAATQRLERAVGDTVRAAAEEHGYRIADHQLELLGVCPDCA